MPGPFDSAGGKGLDSFEREIQGGLDDDGLPEELEVGAEVEPEADDEPEHRPSRDDKKRARRPMLAELEAIREEKRQLEERLARVESDNHATRTALEQARQPQQPQDPFQAERTQLYKEEDELVDSWNRATSLYAAQKQEMPSTEQAEWRNRRRALEEKKADLVTRQALQRAQANGPSQATEAILRSEFGDVYANKNAHAYAIGEFAKLRAMGHPDSIDVARKALATARRDMKTSRGSASDADEQADRRRHAGAPKGSSGGTKSERRSVAWNSDLQRLADSMYKDEPDPKKRAQMWVNENGKEYLEATRKGA